MSADATQNYSAFPSHGSMGEVSHEGMTLRDYFAAHALAGCLPMTEMIGSQLTKMGKPDVDMREFMAVMAYNYADAMLKARQQ